MRTSLAALLQTAAVHIFVVLMVCGCKIDEKNAVIDAQIKERDSIFNMAVKLRQKHPPDTVIAVRLYKKAADMGSQDALFEYVKWLRHECSGKSCDSLLLLYCPKFMSSHLPFSEKWVGAENMSSFCKRCMNGDR